jgi:GntR family transcriptional regulator/MocR family aminotransferase
LESRDWASSVDLHVSLAHGGRRAGLERAIRAAVRNGRLGAGERLPSTRALARDLGLARGTVAEAYAQLAAEGYLRTSHGAPTRVAPEPRTPTASASPPTPARGPRFSLEAGVPDLSAFPRSAWQTALRRALASAPDRALGQSDPRGRPELRAALASYLGRARGVLADPEQIVICAGFTEGLALLAAALRARAMPTVAMENPCLHHHRDVALANGLTVAAMPVDEHGAQPDIPSGAGAVVLTPAHQFPLGATLAPERRAAFIGWARSRNAIVIEDDYDGEFRYDRQPVGALQGLDPDHVVYAGTASKTLAPGLRLGWLALPAAMLDSVIEAKQLLGATPALEQLALAELIRSGVFDRHLRRMRQRYRHRHDQLLALLAERAPAMRPHGIAAGLHVVLEPTANTLGEDELITRAANHSLALDGLHPYWHGDTGGQPGVVLGYAAPAEHEYPATLAALHAALSPG